MVSAVESFNRPTFTYREETLSLLAINAWELMLKAKLLTLNSNDPRCLWVYETRRKKDGEQSKRRFIRRNRAGNPLSCTLHQCISELDTNATTRLDPQLKANLYALIEIRDNATHFVNASPVLAKQVLEIGTATVKNFVEVTRRWFQVDLSSKLSLMLPLSYLDGQKDVDGVVVTSEESCLIKYLRELANTPAVKDSPFAVAIRIDVKFDRSRLDTATKVRVAPDDPDAVSVILSEEDFRDRYPWDYGELVKRLGERYGDFKTNAKFHLLRKPLCRDTRYMRSRFLDPGNPKSARKDFYSTSILREFDKHYVRLNN